MKKKTIALTLIIVLILGITVTTTVCGRTKSSKDELYNQIELFSDAIALIRSDYVDVMEPKDLIYGALDGMLASLDAHSQFMPPEAYKEIRIETKGEFGGLGIEITLRGGVLTIITPLDGTPAHKAGIKAGDMIVRIDGESTRGITLHEAVKKMRGKPGTDVMLTVLREREGKILDIAITRGIIQVKSIKKAQLIEDKIGYIRLSEFQENSPKDLDKGIATLKKEGMQALILDLRNNPGGLLDVSAEIADRFLPKDQLIVTTKGRRADRFMEFKSRRNPICPDVPMIILVNEGSASASEIVAGAIQDNKRGIILGTKTFGKGSVQTVIPLKDGSALRLTTAKYFTPSGRAIREEGIVPDVVVEYEPLPIEPKRKDEAIFEKIEEKKEERIYDNQLLRAIDLIKGLRVYKRILEG